MMMDAEELLAELNAAVGYMRNAKIDLETGATKATAIRTVSGGIFRAEAAIAKAQSSLQKTQRTACPVCGGVNQHNWNCSLNR